VSEGIMGFVKEAQMERLKMMENGRWRGVALMEAAKLGSEPPPPNVSSPPL